MSVIVGLCFQGTNMALLSPLSPVSPLRAAEKIRTSTYPSSHLAPPLELQDVAPRLRPQPSGNVTIQVPSTTEWEDNEALSGIGHITSVRKLEAAITHHGFLFPRQILPPRAAQT